MKIIELILTISLTLGLTSCSNDSVAPYVNAPESIIALAQWDNTFKTHIFTMPPDGKNKKQLTSGQTGYWMPAFSPDGKQIAYVSRLPIEMNIHVMNVDGTNQHQITSTGINMAPSWSPDGTKIAFAHMDPGGRVLDIWLMNAGGTEKEVLTFSLNHNVDNNVPTWSPDGQKIAFTSNRNGGRYQLWTVNLSDSTLNQLTTAYFDSVTGQWIEQKVPAWSPDGKYIAYWQGVEGGPFPNLPWNVWVMSPQGTDNKMLAPGDDPTWSPDSKTIIHPWKITCPDSVSIGGISPDGTNQRLIVYTNCGFGRMSWYSK